MNTKSDAGFVVPPSSSATRGSLLMRARDRQPEAWSDLVELYGPLVAHWCYRCGFDSHSTADLVQDVFGAVSRSLATFEQQRASGAFRAWLWTITANKIRDAVRRDREQALGAGGSTALLNLQQVSETAHLPDEEPTSTHEHQQLISRGLEQVKQEFESETWEIFERLVIDQIPTAIVATEFNRSSAAIRQIRSRVLRRLRQQLGDLDG